MEAYPKADIQEEDAVWDSLDLVYARFLKNTGKPLLSRSGLKEWQH